jgi:flagellar protein FliS
VNKRIIGPYLEQQILSASPLQLINLAYQTAIQAVREARLYVEQKKIPERVRAISLAHGVLAELYRSLDFKAGNGAISRELGLLYDYMMRRLLEANAKPADAPLAEVFVLLCSMGETWEKLAATPEPAARAHTAASSPSRSAASTSWASAGEMNADAGSGSYSISC